MEFENDQTKIVVEKKSGAGKWLIGGCGCLLLLMVVCGGGGYYFYATFMKPALDLTFENIQIAQESEKVKEMIGDPVTLGSPTSTQNGQQLEMSIPVSGPNGNGTVTFTATLNQEDFTWTRDESYLEFNGEKIDIDPDANTSLDIEGLDELAP